MPEVEKVETILVSSSELCEKIPMSDNSLRKYLEDPNFPKYKVHDHFKFKIAEVVEFLRVKK